MCVRERESVWVVYTVCPSRPMRQNCNVSNCFREKPTNFEFVDSTHVGVAHFLK